jgi:hypothetical protein
MSLYKLVSTPLQTKLKLYEDMIPKNTIEKDAMVKIPYSSVVGSLITTPKCVLIHYRFH